MTSTTAAVVGYVDALGYLRCLPCTGANRPAHWRPVYADAAPHNKEACDTCGAVITRKEPTVAHYDYYQNTHLTARLDCCRCGESFTHEVVMELPTLHAVFAATGEAAKRAGWYRHSVMGWCCPQHTPWGDQDTKRSKAARHIEAQRQWMRDCGGDLAGYVRHYGSAADPVHAGDGGEAIYAADLAYLHQLEQRARITQRTAR